MSGTFVVSPESLAATVRQITEGLLSTRFQNRAKSYVKIDFHAFERDEYFAIQITKCSSCGENLKFMFTEALKSQLNSMRLDDHSVLATVQEKSSSALRTRNVVCTRNSSISLVGQPESASDSAESAQKDLSLLKRYICIKLSFQAESVHFDLFSSLLLCHIMEIEQMDPNIKFSFKKDDNQYIYRNHVRMDDIILSCMLLSSYCAKIIQRSEDDDFRKQLARSFNITKSSDFEKTVGCLLLAQADSNFIGAPIKPEKANDSVP